MLSSKQAASYNTELLAQRHAFDLVKERGLVVGEGYKYCLLIFEISLITTLTDSLPAVNLIYTKKLFIRLTNFFSMMFVLSAVNGQVHFECHKNMPEHVRNY